MASNKTIGINLAFTADTQQAKKQVEDLQSYLTKITQNAGKTSPLGITDELSKSIGQVQQLQVALQKATRTDGKLDLGMFRKELNSANLSVQQIGKSLYSLGPDGERAFMQLSQAVTTAEVPMRKTNALLKDFADTLARTAKWQISSTIIHGFTGALRNAYSYAQKLDKSLNDIRIVSGQSADQMASFAKEANKSAQALSASTLAYTDASLIFYQQGLRGEEVKERTDAVIKMSNVTGQSVKDVSSYMTAIWNNFDDGSESLEHYADVITALGAATASSSEEIANGLEKFASIGSTVGLSYEYATSALATVVAATRQSEDVVGTAFKTIFSRIQGLKLGETLEDDIDLNKYSAALNAVGVQVIDVNGDLRALDDILEDLASKWDLLSTAQKTALAQTVAGTRQYAQMMALMNNWDSMQSNLEIARNSEGTLQEQQDIYTESWEAANKKVKASFESLYNELIDDKFFINFNNGIAETVDGLSDFVDALGGIKGILPGLASLLLGLFGKNLTDSINNAIYNFQLFSNKGKQSIQDLRNDFVNQTKGQISGGDVASAARYDVLTGNAALQEQLLQKTKELEKEGKLLTEAEELRAKILLDENNALGEQYIKEAQILKTVQEKNQKQAESIKSNMSNIINTPNLFNTNDAKTVTDEANYSLNILSKVQTAYGSLSTIMNEFNSSLNSGSFKGEDLNQLLSIAKSLKEDFGESSTYVDDFRKHINNLAGEEHTIEEIDELFVQLTADLDKIGTKAQNRFDNLKDIIEIKFKNSIETAQKLLEKQNNILVDDSVKGAARQNAEAKKAKIESYIEKKTVAYNSQKTILQQLNGEIDKYQQNLSEEGSQVVATTEAMKNHEDSIRRTSKAYQDLQGETANVGTAIVQTAQGISTLSMSINSISSLPNIWNEEDKDTGKKILQTMTSLGMALPMLLTGIKSLNTGFTHFSGVIKNNVSVNSILAKTYKECAASGKMMSSAEVLQQQLQKQGITLTEAEVAERMKEIAANNGATTSFKLLGLSVKSFGAALTTVLGPIGIITIALGTVSAAVNAYNNSLEKNAETAKTIADDHQKITDKYTEEADAIKDIVKKVKELYSEYDGASGITEELKSKTFDLVEQYDDLDLKLLALTGDYDAFIKKLNEAQYTANEKIIEAAKLDAKNYETAIDASIESSMGKGLGGLLSKNVFGQSVGSRISETLLGIGAGLATGNIIAGVGGAIAANVTNNTNIEDGWQLKGTSFKNENEKAFLDELSQIEGLTVAEKEALQQGMMNEEMFFKLASEHKDQVNQIVNEYYKEVDAAKQIKSLMTDNVELIDKYTASRNLIKESFLENNFSGENFDVSKGYWKTVQELQEKNAEESIGLTNEEIENYVSKQLLAIDEVAKYARAANLAKILAEGNTPQELQLNIESITEQLKDFDESGLNVITLYPHIAKEKLTKEGKEVLQDWAESLGAFGDFETARNKSDQAKGFLDAYFSSTKNGKNLKFEDKDAIGQLLGYSVYGMSDAEIKTALLDFYTHNYNLAKESQEEARQQVLGEGPTNEDVQKAADDYASALGTGSSGHLSSVALDDDKETLKSFKNLYNEFYEDNEAGIKTLTDVKNAFSELAEVEKEGVELTPELSKKKDVLIDLYGKNGYNSVINYAKAYNNVNARFNEYSNMLSRVTDYQYDYNKVLQTTNDNMGEYNKHIDDIQSAYKTMAAAQKEYDEKQGYSTDTLQSLLALEPQYLQYLSIENDKIIVNTEGLQAQKDATWALLEAEDAQNLSTQLHILLTQKAGNALYDETLRLYETAVASNVASGALEGVIAEVESLDEATRKAIPGLENFYEVLQNKRDIYRLGPGSLEDDLTSKKSGSSKKKERKDLKKYMDEFDRFYPIKKAINDVTDALSDLGKEQEHLSRHSLIKNLKQQNKLLEEQKEDYEELLRQQSDYRNELAGQLGSFGATFDKTTGNLTNYAEITNKALEEYNAAIVKYNNSAQSEADKIAFENSERVYNDFKTILSKYQTILTDMQDTENNIDDATYKQIENNLKQFEIKLQVKLDTESTKRQINDFINSIHKNFKKVYKSTKEWGEEFTTALKDAHTYSRKGGSKGTIAEDLKALDEVRDIVTNKNYVYDENSMFASQSEALDYYYKLQDQLMSDSSEFFDLLNNSWESYIDAIDQTIDQWDHILEGFDKIGSELDHYGKLIDILYKGNKEELKGTLYTAEIENSLAYQEGMAKELKDLKKARKKLLKQGAEETDEDVQVITEQIDKLTSDMNSEVEHYAEVIVANYQNTVAMTINALDKELTKAGGGLGIDATLERWQDAQKAAEGYYDSVERVYELETMETKWEDLINSTKTIKNQKYLKTLMDEQLETLQKKTDLTEYDIELAEKDLEIAKAQIALEEAQNNKSKMKLTRNAEGNWSYQYVADEDDVSKKEQDVLDRTHDKYEFVKKSAADAKEDVLNLYQEYLNRLSDIQNDTNLSEEERKEKMNYLDKYYWDPNDGIIIKRNREANNILGDLNEATMEDLWALYTKDKDNFDLMSEAEQKAVKKIGEAGVTSFMDFKEKVATGDESVFKVIDNEAKDVADDNKTYWQQATDAIIGYWYKNPTSVKNTVDQAYLDMKNAFDDYLGHIKESEEAIHKPWSKLKNQINKAKEGIDDVNTAIDTMVGKGNDLVEHRKKVNKIKNAWDNVSKAIEDALKMLKEFNNTPVKKNTPSVNPTGSYTADNKTADGSGSGTGDFTTSDTTVKSNAFVPPYYLGTDYQGKSGLYYVYDSKGVPVAADTDLETLFAKEDIKKQLPLKNLTKTRQVVSDRSGMPQYTNNYSVYVDHGGDKVKIFTGSQDAIKKFGFDTGGYTGTWNNGDEDGRFALLHQKEMVLNKEDTSNLLSAVNAVKEVSSFGSSITEAISGGITRMISSLLGLRGEDIIANHNNSYVNNSNKEEQQIFNINAEFPNATNVDDIRAAILSLPNLASQYKNRKTK